MSINFIPNDPQAELPMRQVSPRADRPANRAGFEVQDPVVEDEYEVGTPEFLYWQCREAALAAVESWEEIHGSFTSWQDGRSLSVFPDDGEDLNAYYDRKRSGRPERISFFHRKIGNKTYLSGASTDVVAHEAGHAILDAIRPDFWTSFRFEVNSFHEAFGDCIAIVTALHDQASRQAILANVASTNLVETTAEELAAAIKKAFTGHNAGVPRRARNDFNWGPQGSIPDSGGPGVLIYEEHSFGQVFSGCFYDTIVNIFSGLSSQSEDSLLQATQTAGRLLVNAVQQAPQRAQYFREVGRVMILIDEEENGAANRLAIRDAFGRHNIALGSSVTLAPQAAFAPAAAAARPAVESARAAVSPSVVTGRARRSLLEMIGAETSNLELSPVTIAGRKLQKAVHQRLVPLDGLHKKLKGVVAAAPQVALVGQSHNALSIMGNVPAADETIRDVETYVATLVKHARIDFEPEKPSGRRRGRSAVAAEGRKSPQGVTHQVREVRGKKVLERIRFACSVGGQP
jgi:hypothetical protein